MFVIRKLPVFPRFIFGILSARFHRHYRFINVLLSRSCFSNFIHLIGEKLELLDETLNNCIYNLRMIFLIIYIFCQFIGRKKKRN